MSIARCAVPALAALALAASLAAPLSAQAAAKRPAKAKAVALPPALVVDLARRQLDLSGPDAAALTPRLFKAATVTPDGVTDWRLDTAALPDAGFCGSGGCRQLIIVSRGKAAYVVAFDHQVRGLALSKTAKGPATLDIDLHGSECRQAGVAECARRFTWSAPEGRFVEAFAPGGVTRLQGPLLQPVAVDRLSLPADVRAEADALITRCRGLSADDFAESIVSTPDLNGDGIRDWVLGSGDQICDQGRGGSALLPLEVMVSAPGGGFRLAYARPGVSYDIDIARRPAAFVEIEVTPDCGPAAQACFEDTLRWDAPSGRLLASPDGLRHADLMRREEALRRQQDELDRQAADLDQARRAAFEARRRAEIAARQAQEDRRRAEQDRQRAEDDRRRRDEDRARQQQPPPGPQPLPQPRPQPQPLPPAPQPAPFPAPNRPGDPAGGGHHNFGGQGPTRATPTPATPPPPAPTPAPSVPAPPSEGPRGDRPPRGGGAVPAPAPLVPAPSEPAPPPPPLPPPPPPPPPPAPPPPAPPPVIVPPEPTPAAEPPAPPPAPVSQGRRHPGQPDPLDEPGARGRRVPKDDGAVPPQ